MLLNWAAFFLIMRTSLCFWRWALALLGPLQPYVLLALALYVATSFFVYSRPVNALELEAARRRRAASVADVLAAAGEVDLSAAALDEATARLQPITAGAAAGGATPGDKKAD